MAEQYIDTTRVGKFYYKDPDMTILHRTDGPACEYKNGNKMWFVNGKRHRLDGPAAEYFISGVNSWYVNGESIFETDKRGKMYRLID